MPDPFLEWVDENFPDGFWKQNTGETMSNTWNLLIAAGFPPAAAAEVLTEIVSAMRAEYGE